MTAEVALSPDASRALGEAESFCRAANVAIAAAEHVLAGALLVLHTDGRVGLPGKDELEAALTAVQGTGSEALTSAVMFGSAAREALNGIVGAVRAAGGTVVDARIIAAGCIESGEVNPMFFSALGSTRQALLDALV